MKKAVVLLSVLLLVAAGGLYLKMNPLESSVDPVDSKPRIGLSFDSLVVERWKRDLETFVGIANENGLEVVVQIANDSIDEQRRQIQYLIDENVDVLVILPNEFDALEEEIQMAKRKGIKVIAYDRMIANADVDAYISFDNIGIGEMITQKLLDEISDDGMTKNILIINGDPKDYNSYMLNEGYYNVLNREENREDIEIIEEVWAYGWREFHAFNLVEKVLNEGKRIDGIIAANDVLATGAIEALSERQLAGEVPIVSMDAELSACQRIVEGTQLATIYKPINQLSKTAVGYCMRLIDGDSLDEEQRISDGTYDVPYISIKGEVVDIDTIDEVIIDSGFHSRENVYMNVRK